MKEKARFDYDRFGSAFLDMRMHKLRLLITRQSDALLERHGVVTPSSCLSVVLFLHMNGAKNNTQIAAVLGYSQQLINLRIGSLEKRGLIERNADPRDSRRKLVTLSALGETDAARISAVVPVIAHVIDEVLAELNIDFMRAVKMVDASLQNKPLAERAADLAPADVEDLATQ